MEISFKIPPQRRCRPWSRMAEAVVVVMGCAWVLGPQTPLKSKIQLILLDLSVIPWCSGALAACFWQHRPGRGGSSCQWEGELRAKRDRAGWQEHRAGLRLRAQASRICVCVPHILSSDLPAQLDYSAFVCCRVGAGEQFPVLLCQPCVHTW